MNSKPLVVHVYATEGGREPFAEWLENLADRESALRIRARILRVGQGNLGDFKTVSKGMFELRCHFGPGYRIYCGRDGDTVVVLLCGGDKDTQARDIATAKRFWADYLERRPS